MNTNEHIQAYLAAQPEPKRRDLADLHHLILELRPQSQL